MAVRIRMSRIGRTNRAFYRIGAYDSRSPRNGKSLEILGWFDPTKEKLEDQLRLKLERVQHWLSVGAQATHKTEILLKKAGVIFPTKRKAKKKKDTKKAQPTAAAAPQKGGKEKDKSKKEKKK